MRIRINRGETLASTTISKKSFTDLPIYPPFSKRKLTEHSDTAQRKIPSKIEYGNYRNGPRKLLSLGRHMRNYEDYPQTKQQSGNTQANRAE